jgi:hypothetical protein
MDTAVIEEFEEWSIATGRVLARIDDVAGDDEESAVAAWAVVIESFSTHRRMWAAVVSEFLAGGDPTAVAHRLGFGPVLGHRGLAGILMDVTAGTLGDDTGPFDPVPPALLVGVAVQWLTDPAGAPSACAVVESIRALRDVERATADGATRNACCDPLHNRAAARYDAVLI